jgi:hypothetical protein
MPVAHACNPSYSGGRDQPPICQPGEIVPETLSQNPSQKKG